MFKDFILKRNITSLSLAIYRFDRCVTCLFHSIKDNEYSYPIHSLYCETSLFLCHNALLHWREIRWLSTRIIKDNVLLYVLYSKFPGKEGRLTHTMGSLVNIFLQNFYLNFFMINICWWMNAAEILMAYIKQYYRWNESAFAEEFLMDYVIYACMFLWLKTFLG